MKTSNPYGKTEEKRVKVELTEKEVENLRCLIQIFMGEINKYKAEKLFTEGRDKRKYKI